MWRLCLCLFHLKRVEARTIMPRPLNNIPVIWIFALLFSADPILSLHSPSMLVTNESPGIPLSISLIGPGGVVQTTAINASTIFLDPQQNSIAHISATYIGPQAGITLQLFSDTPIGVQAQVQYVVSRDGVLTFNQTLDSSVPFGPQLFVPSFQDLSVGTPVIRTTEFEIQVSLVSAPAPLNLSITCSIRADFALMQYVNGSIFSWPETDADIVNPWWGGQVLYIPSPSPSTLSIQNGSTEYVNFKLYLNDVLTTRLPAPIVIQPCLTAIGVNCNTNSACLGNILPTFITHNSNSIHIGASASLQPPAPGCSNLTGAFYLILPNSSSVNQGQYSYTATSFVSLTTSLNIQPSLATNGLSGAAISGIVVGVVVGSVILLIITCLVYRHQQKNQYEPLS